MMGLLIGSGAVAGAADGVMDGYTVPAFVIPYAAQAPVMDGVIDAAEWKHALQVNLTQQLKSRDVSAMQAVWMQDRRPDGP